MSGLGVYAARLRMAEHVRTHGPVGDWGPDANAEGARTSTRLLPGHQKGALVTHIRWTHYSDEGRPAETADIGAPGRVFVPVRDMTASTLSQPRKLNRLVTTRAAVD
ncbi:hypothetical protein GCM10009540_72900 [Streptomyces turgidiscabies]